MEQLLLSLWLLLRFHSCPWGSTGGLPDILVWPSLYLSCLKFADAPKSKGLDFPRLWQILSHYIFKYQSPSFSLFFPSAISVRGTLDLLTVHSTSLNLTFTLSN